MRIFVDGKACKDFAPDQISCYISFSAKMPSYDEALATGVERVKNFLQYISEQIEVSADEFKTSRYYVHELTHIQEIEAKTEADLKKNLRRTVSDGFRFSQYATITFDYDREKLAKMIVMTSKHETPPELSINFELKDPAERERELIAPAYEDAKNKASALAVAAGKHLRDCVNVEIDAPRHGGPAYEGDYSIGRMAKMRDGASMSNTEDEIKSIDENFHPEPITVSKKIACIWETSD